MTKLGARAAINESHNETLNASMISKNDPNKNSVVFQTLVTRNLNESELQGPRQGTCLINDARKERTKSENAEDLLDRSV